VRRLRLEVDRIPDGFTTSAAIEELWVSGGKSVRDLSCFTDLSQLTVLEVQRAARLDIADLTEASNLKSLELVYCREVVGFDSVVDLPHLRSIQVFSVHSIPDFDSLTRFGGGRLFVEGNYVFDEEFQSRFRDRKGWHFSPYKPKRSPGVSASAHATFVEGVDVSTFAPFEISEGDDGSFHLTYEDWTGFEEILGDAPGAESSDTADLIAEAELRRAAPELLTTPGFTFDSEGGLMMIRTESLGDIERVARVLLGVWGNTRRMRTLARKAISSPRGVTSAE
jgi:hypothetical protein